MMDYTLRQTFRFQIAFQTVKDNWKTTIIFTLLFGAMSTMYSGFYPQFKDFMMTLADDPEMANFFLAFGGGSGDVSSFIGFLNLELYSIFFVLILGIIIAFVASSSITKEIESKTIDLLMSNPVSRKQIIFEKFIGLIPMTLIINFFTMIIVLVVSVAINESINVYYLFLAHLYAVPYFLAVISISLLISTFIDEKMKASMFTIAILVGMFFMEYISHFVPDYDKIGLVSLTHFYKPYDTLKFGAIDASDIIVFSAFITICLVIAMIYFEHKDIKI